MDCVAIPVTMMLLGDVRDAVSVHWNVSKVAVEMLMSKSKGGCARTWLETDSRGYLPLQNACTRMMLVDEHYYLSEW